MRDDDRELLGELGLLARELGSFALGVMDDSLSRAQHIVLGMRLVDLAERIRDRALRTPVVIDGQAVAEEPVRLSESTVDSRNPAAEIDWRP